MTIAELPPLAPSARRLIERACELAGSADGRHCGVNHYLRAILEQNPELLLRATLGEFAELPEERLKQIAAGEPGVVIPVHRVVRAALEVARERGSDSVWGVDLVTAVLRHAGIHDGAEPEGLKAHDEAPAGQRRKTPALDKFGRDVTAEAAAGRLASLVGRDEEIQTCIEVLCRVFKRNPVLLGAAGVGKTAIVEGLAQRIVAGDVPGMLADTRVVEIRMTSVLAELSAGALEARIGRILHEAADEGAVLFIDEMHTILGGGQAIRNISEMLKPALARGKVALIGATTDDEYRRVVEQDSALERRFQPVLVPEMDRAAALRVLQSHRDRLQQLRGVALGDEILDWLVGFTDDFMHNRHFPDKALDMLEQCIAHAVVCGRTELDRETAEAVAQRLVGMPLDFKARLTRLGDQLAATALISESDAEALFDRLRLAMGGHDFEPARPNAVVLLAGRAATRADLLAAVCAEALYGSSQRVVSIDVTGFRASDGSAFVRLLGMPYGYVGAHLNQGAVQMLNAQPWTTLIIRGIDLCDGVFRSIVTDALRKGYFVDAHGVKQYLSDAVVFLVAGETEARGVRPGFAPQDAEDSSRDERRRFEELLGKSMMSQCQIITQTGPVEQATRGWLTAIALPSLVARYAGSGLDIEWDDSAVEWLVRAVAPDDGPEEWRSLLEAELAPHLSAILGGTSGERRFARVVAQDDGLVLCAT